MQRTAWITGSNGLIGNNLVQCAPQFAPEFRVIGLTREIVDLTDSNALRKRFLQDRPRLIIHCAALSKSPACQANPALAWKTNVEATQALVGHAAGIPFIFFSSDLVFDGKKGNYVENDATNPLSVYAETKVAAEIIALKNPLHTVVRTSLNAGITPTGDRAFNEELVNEWKARRRVKLFTDEFRCPIAAGVTARAIWELTAKNKPGLYHLAGSERLSRLQIGQILAAQYPELDPRIESSSLSEYRGAPRAPDTSLDCSKLQKLLSFPLPKFSDSLPIFSNNPPPNQPTTKPRE